MIGQTLSHYRIMAELGRGGMGVVYRAHDLRLDRNVAIKVLPPEFVRRPGARARLLREARSVAALEHPHICGVHEVDETTDGLVFMVMPCYRGETLRERLERGPLSIDHAFALGMQIVSALHAAHGKGIVHRDLKPENVLLTEDGTHAVLMDFGLAKVHDATQITQTGATVGTILYMSPEQVQGRDLDARTDLWSLGVMLYQMTTGRRPFQGETAAAILYAILHDDPPAPSTLRRDLPVAIDDVIGGLLRKDRATRLASAVEVQEMLSWAGSALSTRDTTVVPLARRAADRRRSHRRGLYVVAIGVVVAAVGLWTLRPAPRIASIAVLPLEDLAGASEEPYFADGMTDQLISGLARIPELRVISRRSVMRFKDSTRSIRDIAEELDVDAIVEGSVSRGDQRVRVNARLVDGRRESTVWDISLERPLADVFHLQADLAEAIAREIRGALAVNVAERIRAAHEVDPEAYAEYLRGMYWWNRDVEGFEIALTHFQMAVDLDPAFALAYAGLAQVYTVLGCHGVRPPYEVRGPAKAALERAKQLAPDDPDVLTAEGHYLFEYEWDFRASERALRRAIELSPSHSMARHVLGAGLYRVVRGHDDEAVELLEDAFALDPLSPNLSADLAMTLRRAGRLVEADEQLQRTEQMFPEWDNRRDRADQFIAEGRIEEGLALLDSWPAEQEDRYTTAWRIEAYARLGDLEQARGFLERLRELDETEYVPSIMWATAYDAVGETEAALRWLEIGLEEGHPWIPRMVRHRWLTLGGDRRLASLLERIGPRS